MADIALEWPFEGTPNGGFAIGPDGDIATVAGDAEVRQRITRRLLTSPRSTANDGTILAPELIFDCNYGMGTRRLVGSAVSQSLADNLRQKCLDGCSQEDGIAQSPPPQVTMQAANNGVALSLTYTSTVSGRLVALPKVPLQ